MPARGPRYEAQKLGLKHYSTGKPCYRGHVCERLVSNKCCVECNKIKARKFRSEDPNRHRNYVRISRRKNPEKTKQQDRENHLRHREKRNAYKRLYNQKYRKKLNAYNLEWKKRDTNAAKFHRIGHLLRSRLKAAIRNKQKVGSAVHDLGCSIEWFMAYIAAQFKDGMTWENHGKVWQLDHIKPVKDFDLTKREQFLEACHFTNLQPLSIAAHRNKTAMELKTRKEN